MKLKSGEHVIYLEEVDDDNGYIAGGYLIQYNGINNPIYARGSLKNAMVMSRAEAIEVITDFQDSDWDCRAVPPIIVEF